MLSIDTRNEHEVGEQVKKSGIPRNEIYIVTKVKFDSIIIGFD